MTTLFQPTNRNIVELVSMPGSDAAIGGAPVLVGLWYVDDVDHHGNVIAYRSATCTSRIMPGGQRGFVVCSDRGMFLRHPKQRNGRKGTVRYFKMAFDAAVEAECIDAEIGNSPVGARR